MRTFGEDECGFLAGAVAYQLFFALLPLLFLLVGVLGFFLTEEQVRGEVTRFVRDILPLAGERRVIDELAAGRTLSLGIGLIGTLWSVTAIHDALGRALGVVFGCEPARPFVRDKFAAVGFAALLLLLGLLSFAFSFVVQALSDLLVTAGLGEAQRVALGLASPTFGLLAGIALFALIYRAVPRRRLRQTNILLGAVVAAVLWEVAKSAFALYARNLGVFRAYGALALAAGLLTWIYLSAIILLFGAEIIKAFAAETERRPA